jgi:hypothetical protein
MTITIDHNDKANEAIRSSTSGICVEEQTQYNINDKRGETDDDVYVLLNDLNVLVKTARAGDMVQNVHDSSAKSSKPV